jgi:hypothetical protein
MAPPNGLRSSLAPAALAHAAASLDLATFLARYGGATLLLVQVPESDWTLMLGLEAAIVDRPTATAGPQSFRTALRETTNREARQRSDGRDVVGVLRTMLDDHMCFAVNIEKRVVESDSVFEGRIGVGRATDKDIVLRHASVSKFHAWFEIEAPDSLFLTDAGSTNGTFVNGARLKPNVRAPITSGDCLRFGSIASVVCWPEELWSYLHPRR